jgi:hypothetical protein
MSLTEPSRKYTHPLTTRSARTMLRIAAQTKDETQGLLGTCCNQPTHRVHIGSLDFLLSFWESG